MQHSIIKKINVVFFLHSFKKNNAMYRSGNIEIFFHILMCYKVMLIDFVKKNDFPNFEHFDWLNSQISFDN